MIHLTAYERAFDLHIPADDHIARVITETGDWYERAMLDDILGRSPKGTAIDVGACFGTHTAWLAGVCGMHVVALEPNSYAYELLLANVHRNALDADVRFLAAGNRAGCVDVEPSKLRANLGATTLKLRGRDATGGVPMATIDSLGLEDVGLIKIDVEGMEIRVLEGAAETIRKWHPLIYVESGASYRQVAAMLRALGYEQDGRFNKTPTYCFMHTGAEVGVQTPSAPTSAPVAHEAGEPRTLSAAIMAHRKRERFAPYWAERLPGVPVIWDTKDDRWDTGRRAMLAYDPAATHHIVIQDDAIIPYDFLAGVERAIQTVPNNPISFYIGKVRPNAPYVEHMVKRALAAGVTWIAMEGPWWGPAVVIPTAMIPAMVAWCDTRAHIPNYDRRMSRYFLSKNIECWYSVPSLVSHRTGDDNPSLVPGRGSGPGRVAFNFLGEDASALDVEWSAEAVRPDRTAPRRVQP